MSNVNEKNLVLTRAKSAVLSRDFATAARLYKNLLKDDPSNVDYLKELGAIYVKNGEDAKAIPYYEQIITFYPHYVEAMNSLGAIYRRLKRYEDSIQILNRALEEDRQTSSVNYNLGFTYKEMGNYDDAIEAFEIVVYENPSDVLAYNHLGKIYFDKKDYKKSINSYKHGLAVDKNHPVLNYNLALCYTEAKMYTDAIRCFETALKAKPGWVEAIRDFSKLLINCQKTKEASDLVHRSIDLHPNDSKLLCLLGRIYIDQYDYDEAVKTFKKAEEIDESDIQILTGLAEALEKGDYPQEALDAVVKAMELEPENRDIKKQYVHTLLSAQEYDAAQVNIQELYEDNGQNDLQILDLYGQYYICTGDEDNLQKTQEKIVKLNKHYKNHLLNAAERYSQVGNNNKAEYFAKQFVAREIRNPAGYNMLGKIYGREGAIKDAIDAFDRSRNLKRPNVLADRQIKHLQKQLEKIATPIENPEEEHNTIFDENRDFDSQLIEATDDEAQSEDNFDYDQMGDSVPMEESLLENEDSFFNDLDSIEEEINDSTPDEDMMDDYEDLLPNNPVVTEDADKGNVEAGQNELSNQNGASSQNGNNSQAFESGTAGNNYSPFPDPVSEPVVEYSYGSPYSEPQEPSSFAMETALSAQKLAQSIAEEQQDLKNRIQSMEKAIEKRNNAMENHEIDTSDIFEDTTGFTDGAVLSDAETESLLGNPEENELSQDSQIQEFEDTFDQDFFTPEENPEDFSDFEELEEVVESEETLSDDMLPGGLLLASDTDFEAQTDEVKKETVKDLKEDFNFWTVDDILNEIQQQLDKANGIEVLEEVDYILPENNETAATEETVLTETMETDSVGNTTAEMLLPNIEKILSDDSIASENIKNVVLFKKLLSMSQYLPECEKENFLSGKPRMQMEYLISKLSGKPGLLQTSQSLRKTGVLGESSSDELKEPDLSNEAVRGVIKLMKKLTDGLDDKYLAKALCCSADNILEQIELRDQQVQIF